MFTFSVLEYMCSTICNDMYDIHQLLFVQLLKLLPKGDGANDGANGDGTDSQEDNKDNEECGGGGGGGGGGGDSNGGGCAAQAAVDQWILHPPPGAGKEYMVKGGGQYARTTPLLAAAAAGQNKCLELLVKAGAAVDGGSPDNGTTPLMIAR